MKKGFIKFIAPAGRFVHGSLSCRETLSEGHPSLYKLYEPYKPYKLIEL